MVSGIVKQTAISYSSCETNDQRCHTLETPGSLELSSFLAGSLTGKIEEMLTKEDEKEESLNQMSHVSYTGL